jgi:hypothetical protein
MMLKNYDGSLQYCLKKGGFMGGYYQICTYFSSQSID